MKRIKEILGYLILGYTQKDREELKERERQERVHDLTMGKPIILTGKDSIRFHEQLKYNETHPIPKEERDRIISNYQKIMAKAKL